MALQSIKQISLSDREQSNDFQSNLTNQNPSQLVDVGVSDASGVIDNLTNQIPEVPNVEDVISNIPSAEDIIPEIPEVPDFKGLLGSFPLPSFRKPQKIRVEKPPLPRKLTKQTKIPKIPKIPNVAGTIASVSSAAQNAVSNASSDAQNASNSVTNNLPI